MAPTIIIQPDLKLLEELIGTEATLQLRQGIVETFAERHLKAVANSEAIKERLDWLKNELLKQFTDQVHAQIGKISQGYTYSGNGVQLTDTFKAALKATAIGIAEEFLGNTVRELVQEKYTDLYNQMVIAVDQRLNQKFDKALETHIQREVERRLAAIASQIK